MSAALLPADWPAPKTVRAFTTLRHDAGMSAPPFDRFNLGNARAADGDDPEVVERNRAELIHRFGLPSRPRWLKQVHGTTVQIFNHPDHSDDRFDRPYRPPDANATSADLRNPQEPEADAAVTATRGAVLAILTADCLPVLLCAEDGSEVAAAHAGWRGLAGGVLEASIAAVRTPPDKLIAWLGPAAGPQQYEVGIEVYDAFVSRDRAAGAAFASTRPDHWHVDLYALARRRLQAAGLDARRIHGGDLCTISDPQRFYSHRRDRRTGRMASLIWMESDR